MLDYFIWSFEFPVCGMKSPCGTVSAPVREPSEVNTKPSSQSASTWFLGRAGAGIGLSSTSSDALWSPGASKAHARRAGRPSPRGISVAGNGPQRELCVFPVLSPAPASSSA